MDVLTGYKEVDDLTFLGMVYRLICKRENSTTIYDDKFMGTPLGIKGGVATIIDLEKRTIKDAHLALTTPIHAKFKAIMWEGTYSKRIRIIGKWHISTVRVIVDIISSSSGIDEIVFSKTVQNPDIHPGLSIEWGKCSPLPPK